MTSFHFLMRLIRKRTDEMYPNIIVTPTSMDYLSPAEPTQCWVQEEFMDGYAKKLSIKIAWAPWIKLI
jgi:hypothetical protein